MVQTRKQKEGKQKASEGPKRPRRKPNNGGSASQEMRTGWVGPVPTSKTLAPQIPPEEIRKDDAAYLHSFLAPANAARGPKRSEDPTIIGSMTFTGTVNVGATATPTVTWPTTGTSNVSGTDGAIALFCGPTWFTNKTTTSLMSPGFSYSPVASLAANVEVTLSDGKRATPFKDAASGAEHAYRESFPGQITDGGSGVYEPSNDGATALPWRILASRSTLTVTEPAFSAKGFVHCGDLGTIFHNDGAGRRTTDYITTGPQAGETIVSKVESELDELLGKGLSNGNFSRRIRAVGPFDEGASYEAVFLPTNGRILDYANYLPTLCFGGGPNNVSDALVNCPYTVFILTGLSPEATVVLTSEITFEMPVTLKGPLGIMAANARFAHNWLPEWERLANLSPGGAVHEAMGMYHRSAYGKVGGAVASGYLQGARANTNVARTQALNVAPTIRDHMAKSSRVTGGLRTAAKWAQVAWDAVGGAKTAKRLFGRITEVPRASTFLPEMVTVGSVADEAGTLLPLALL